MLTATEANDIRSLLARFNQCEDGETVVANLLRSLLAKIVDKNLAKIVLCAWSDSVKRADASYRSGSISAEHALKLTESELLSAARPSPLWENILLSNPFRPTPAGIGSLSNIKNLATILKYIYGLTDLPDPHSGTPLPLSHNLPEKARKRQLERISRAMASLNAKSPVKDAVIHHKKWFWVTPSQGLENVLKQSFDSEAAAIVVDKLGLVHFSREFPNQSATERYIVEIRISPSFSAQYAKPSFIFSDHNPRFTVWTDTAARSDTDWGRAADLGAFHNETRLAHGYKEMIGITPNSFLRTDILEMKVLGYLDINRWGQKSGTPEGTKVFANLLRDTHTKDDIVESILNELES